MYPSNKVIIKKCIQMKYTCFHRAGIHGYNCYKKGCEDIDYGEEEIHFDRSRQIRLRPSQPW